MITSVASRWRKGPMSELIIPFATKVLMSAVLLLLAIILMWQVWRMWFDLSLVLAPFDFLEEGKPSAESGEQFARMVRVDLQQLADLYNAGEVANSAAVPSSSQGNAVVPMEIPAEFDTSFFEKVEIKAYGLEFGSVFKSLRRQIESPSEITGTVIHQGNTYSVFAELRQPRAGAESLQRWSIQYGKDLPGTARNLACRLFRSLATNAQRKNPDAALFQAIDDEDFCLFNHALAAYDHYRRRKATLSDAEAATLLAEADKPLADLVGREVVTFPYLPKLAALVFYEQKKYIGAESAIERYMAWLDTNARKDKAAEIMRANIKSKKLQTTPAVSRLRPVHPGSSVGSFADKGAGMICCVVKDTVGRRYLLSAASVFGSTVDVRIVQPAVRDGGTEADVVADREKVTSTMAIARMRENVETNPQVLDLGIIKGFASKPADEQVVVTFGFDGKRREGKVLSTVSSLEIDIVSEPGKSVSVENFIVTSDISSGGEIGAPVLTPEGNLVGMIFATGGPTTVVLPVEPTLKELGLELAK